MPLCIFRLLYNKIIYEGGTAFNSQDTQFIVIATYFKGSEASTIGSPRWCTTKIELPVLERRFGGAWKARTWSQGHTSHRPVLLSESASASVALVLAPLNDWSSRASTRLAVSPWEAEGKAHNASLPDFIGRGSAGSLGQKAYATKASRCRSKQCILQVSCKES